MHESLSVLCENLVQAGTDNFKHTRRHFESEEQFSLLLRKGVFPYSYLQSFSVFEETQLPPKSAFHNDLTDSDISDDDYSHALNVWNAFNCQTLQDYLHVYLKADILQLSDIFESFADMAFSDYGLDVKKYISLPSYSYDAMLKMSGVTIELITDVSAYLMVESAVRGGISTISHRFSRANNKMIPDYDESKPTSYIVYLDMVNLYSYSMSLPLPVGDYKFLEQEEIDKFDILSVDPQGKTGFFVDCSLEYSPSLHSSHSDFPMAPSHLIITKDMLSPASIRLGEQLGQKFKPCKKLAPTLLDKEHYVCHSSNLQFYVRHGLIVTKIHRILSFTQTPFLKPYIDFNSSKRQQAKNSFEKQFYKLANNAIYGRTLMNKRDHNKFILCTNKKQGTRVASKPNFKNFNIISKNLTLATLAPEHVCLDTPISAGCAILDLSKLRMFQFHYEYIKKRYPGGVTEEGVARGDAILLFTDTDSFAYKIFTENVYQDICEDRDEQYDTSDFPEDHICHSVKKQENSRIYERRDGWSTDS